MLASKEILLGDILLGHKPFYRIGEKIFETGRVRKMARKHTNCSKITHVYIANVTFPPFNVIHPARATEHCTVCIWHCCLKQVIIKLNLTPKLAAAIETFVW